MCGVQTLSEIRAMLAAAGLSPQKRFGQNFLIDQNLLAKVVELAGPLEGRRVLEVGPGTGTLSEELLAAGASVLACEIDRGLCELLAGRLGHNERFELHCGDVLASKHQLSPEVLGRLGPRAVLVSNLPYNIATPLVMQCLIDSWRVARGRDDGTLTRFDSLTFTVQKEVAERFAASPSSGAYGPVSVVAALLGRVQLGTVLGPGAFWPQPTVASQIVRIDFDETAATAVSDIDALVDLLALAFGQRRKQIGSIVRRKGARWSSEQLAGALAAAGVEPTRRAEQLQPQALLAVAEALAGPREASDEAE
jgi:16S rRNA (adenine1518-N6/adenine1519-N6)-dimethyltransferase